MKCSLFDGLVKRQKSGCVSTFVRIKTEDFENVRGVRILKMRGK